jgi:hypothetical protein
LGVGVVEPYRQKSPTAHNELQRENEKKEVHATSLGDARTYCSNSRPSARVQLIAATAVVLPGRTPGRGARKFKRYVERRAPSTFPCRAPPSPGLPASNASIGKEWRSATSLFGGT